MISLIAAVSKNGVIGVDNKLPWHLPEDLKRFRELTRGKTVLMGRKTFESILGYSGGKPLPNRVNVVVTRDQNYAPPPQSSPTQRTRAELGAGQARGEEEKQNFPPLVGGVRGGGADGQVEVFHSVDDALTAHADHDIMVIGGGEIYKQTIDKADTLYMTEVDQEIKGDAYFPVINRAQWKEVSREPHEGFSFVNYARKA